MAVKVLRWLGNVILSGIAYWVLAVGGGLVASAVVAGVSGLDQPWVSLFAIGIFLLSMALIAGAIRLVVALLPLKARRKLKLSPTPPRFPLPPWRSVQQQLSDLIEEGRRLRGSIPAPATDPAGRLAQLAGSDVTYPAMVYEWEMRGWRLVGSVALAQWRGLFPITNQSTRSREPC